MSAGINIDLYIVGEMIINMTVVSSDGVIAISGNICAVGAIVKNINIRMLGIVLIIYVIVVTNCALSYMVGMFIYLDVSGIDINVYGFVSAVIG